MYKVFLVDDEIVIREGIRKAIPWNETPFVLAGEAPDGEMALAGLNEIRPHILITDIRMPFLDGLGLARIVKETQPGMRIIILSGHDEFQYAREALTLGVDEYLLKPVSGESLLESLNTVAAKIDEDEKARAGMETLRREASGSTEIIRERWLCDLTAGHIPSAAALEQSKEMGLDLVARAYAVMLVQIDASSGIPGQLISVREAIKTTVNQRVDAYCFSEGPDRLLIIVKQLDARPLAETTAGLSAEIKSMEKEDPPKNIRVETGDSVERIGELSRSLSSAADRAVKVTDTRCSPGSIRLIPGEVNLISNRLSYAAEADIEELVSNYADLLKTLPDHSPYVCNYLLGDLIIAAKGIAGAYGEDIKDIMPEILSNETIESAGADEVEFLEYLRRFIKAIISYRESKKDSGRRRITKKAAAYIETHFADKDISLQKVADFVNVSPNHFSTLYARETGRNFIEHLSSLRIENAKILLTTSGLTNAEIGYRCGFTDPHYFSASFKKHVGLSPREYRSEKNTKSAE